MPSRKMMGMITFSIVLYLSCTVLPEMMTNGECELVQYLNIGENGIIQCSFETFLGLSWYNSDENRDILFYKDGDKTGEGFFSGEYDIYPNGSLLVRNVTVEHEGVFTVTKVISDVDANTTQYNIHVKTVVKPTTSYPIIDECAHKAPSCLISVNSDGHIRCYLDKSRPPVNLTWIAKKHESDIILPSSYSSFSHDNITFTSQTIATYTVSQLSLLNMVICQLSSIPNDLVLEKESVILLEKIFDYTDAVTPKGTPVEINVDIMLPCSDKTIGSTIWKQLLNGKDSWSTILYTIPPTNHFTEYYLKAGFDVNSEGSLLLSSIKPEQEGLYACIHQDDRKEDITLYDVKVYVNPVPAYPVVEGCNYQQYCVLHVADGDFLNCSIFGIRPEVILEWKALQDTGKVSFEDRSHSVKPAEDRFDVILTSRVSFSPSSGNRITVECRVTGSNSHLFDLSTTMDLVFENVHVSNQPALAILVIIPIFAVVIVAVIFITVLLRRRAPQRERVRRALTGEEDGERFLMMQGVNESSEPTSAKVTLFIAQLKTKYAILYDSVQPIPYIKDRMYCVDKVYVEGGIEHLTDVARRIWKTLTSYHELLTTCLSSKRHIIEGEPGYGKSMLMLQLVYDWCNNIRSSPFSATNIIIYLSLRQLSGVKSIATAIRRFILPKDTSLSEDDINAILGKSSKILILLDGYDEYPDQNNPESFVNHILKRELFQDAEVVLTTRSSCLPKKLTPDTSRVRLTGFNEESRDAYLTKAVTGKDKNTAKKIKRKLLDNPVLGDLCVVPLFFVMFAHITHENKDLPSFKSVTSFFSYMIECFHSHMRNKMDDENVTCLDILKEDHKILDKIAFDALNTKNQKIVWEKEVLTEELGQEFYNQYVRLGILVEEEVLVIPDESKPLISPRYKWEVRFYHKVFCEWYAAYHLSERLRSTDCDKYEEFFKYLDPYDLQYLYRFTCGIDKNASREIIQHFQSSVENKKFAVLCMFEHSSNNEVVLEQIQGLVSATSTSIKMQDTKLLQRSTIQILDIASKNKMKICSLVLENSFQEIEGGDVILKSGIGLPSLPTLENIEIRAEKGTEITQENVLELISYGSTCTNLSTMKFSNCILPLSYPPAKLTFKVLWTENSVRLQLNPETGQWKKTGPESSELVVDLHDTLRNRCGKEVTISKHDKRQIQRTISCLLEIASYHEVQTPRLILDEDFYTFKDRKITLSSGTSLPPLPFVEKLLITTIDKEVTPKVVLGLLDYGRLCSGLTELRFHESCKLPLSVDTDVISPELRSWTVPVRWCPSDRDFELNSKSGQWEVDDIDYVRDLCSNDVRISNHETIMQRRSTIQLLKIASNHNISISCIRLDRSFDKVDKDKMMLKSGLTLPKLLTMEKIHIETADDRELTKDDVNKIFTYGLASKRLHEISFGDCLLPLSYPPMSVFGERINKNIKVFWCRYGYRLHLKSGLWRVENVDTLKTLCSTDVYITKFQSELQRNCSIELLRNASRLNIHISSVSIWDYSPRMDESDFILYPGVSLPVMSSLQTLRIKSRLSNEDFAAILRYSSQCTNLKQLRFISDMLPTTVPLESIPAPLISRNVEVQQHSSTATKKLNFKTGDWEFSHMHQQQLKN